MSADGRYLLHYEPQPYLKPTPMDRDLQFLLNEYGGDVTRIDDYDVMWVPPKRTLLRSHVERLLADQVLESIDGSDWRIVSAAT